MYSFSANSKGEEALLHPQNSYLPGVKNLFFYIPSSMKSKTATIFVSGNECLFLSTSFFLALLHGGSVPIIVGTMNNYVNFLFEIKTQPGVLLRPKR